MFGILKQWLNKRPEMPNCTQKPKYIPIGSKEVIKGKGMQFETQMYIREKTADEQRIWELNRRATELKGVDWNASIACLAEAQKMRPQVLTRYTILEYLRLPVFLQQAGRMAEAEAEFKQLLNQFDGAFEKEHIYDKMRLTCQREKRFDEAVVFGVMSLTHSFLGEKDREKRYEREYKDTAIHYKRMLTKYKNSPSIKNRHENWLAAMPEGLSKQKADIAANVQAYKERLPESINKLLKKAKKENCLEDCLHRFDAFLVTCTPVAAKKLGEQIAACLQDARVE